MTKGEMRAGMERLLAGLEPADLRRRSELAARRLAQTQAWSGSHVVLCFLSMPHELDSAPLISAAHGSGRRVAAPRIQGEVIRFFYLPRDPGSSPATAGASPFLELTGSPSSRARGHASWWPRPGWHSTGGETGWAEAKDTTTGFWERRAPRSGGSSPLSASACPNSSSPRCPTMSGTSACRAW